MLLTGYVYVTNLVYHLSFLFCRSFWWDQLPVLLPTLFSTSGPYTFAVSPTFPWRSISLEDIVILNACVSKLLFTVFLFSIILFLRLHMMISAVIFFCFVCVSFIIRFRPPRPIPAARWPSCISPKISSFRI